MRRVVGLVLVGLGVFLLVLAPLLRFFAAPQLAVAPIGCVEADYLVKELCDDGVSISPSEGEASALFRVSSLSVEEGVEITNIRRIKPDREASTSERAVYESSLTSYDSEKLAEGDAEDAILSSATELIPFDRHSAKMIDCCDASVNSEPIEDFNGLAPYKFPFFAEKTSYDYFDAVLGQALPMEYVGEEEVAGVDTYKYEMTIEATDYAELEVPGALVGSDEDSVVSPRAYANIRTVWVEPTTGVIVRGQEQQRQFLRGPDGDEALTLLEAELTFTEDNTRNAAHLAKDGADQLNLIRTTIPLIALVAGLVALAVGLVLLLGGRRSSPSGGAHATTSPGVQTV